jgi:hypothetical protein
MIGLAMLTVIADVIAYRAWLADEHARLNQLALESLLCSQNGLLWIWAWMGTTRASVRLSVAMIGTLSIVGILSLPRGEGAWLTLTEFVVMAGGISLLMGAWRFSEGRLGLTTETAVDSSRPSLQFSLRSAMEVVTGFAIALTLTRIIYSPLRDPYYFARAWSWFAILGLSFAIVSTLAFWAVFGRGPTVVRCIVLAMTASLLTGVLGGPKGWIEIFGALVDAKPAREIPLQATLVAIALFVFRFRGYRMVRLRGAPDRCSVIDEPGRVQRR